MGVVNAHQCTNCDLNLAGDNLTKIVASFSSNLAIGCINYDDQNRVRFNLYVLNKHNLGNVLVTEILMPRFYFNLASRESHIPDDFGKELDTLHHAYLHARKLIDKILSHVGCDDGEAWKVIISNDEHDAQMVVPFSVSQAFRVQRRKTG
jgi:hypothetical protein